MYASARAFRGPLGKSLAYNSLLDSESLAGPIVVTGILTGEDARRAVDEGAAAAVISNHGGRRLGTAQLWVRSTDGVTNKPSSVQDNDCMYCGHDR